MNNFTKPKVIVVLGQTATGKSELAVKLARKINGEVISADSRQVYRGLDIGTGKITKKEMKGVPHHLLDIADPKQKFTVAQYQKYAIKAMADIRNKGKIPIICGGTGFYIDAITKGTVFPEVLPNAKLRKRLTLADDRSLLLILKKLDPRRAKEIEAKNEQHNKVRLIRAIEIAETLGKVPEIAQENPVYEFVKIGLFLPKEKLEKKVRTRVKKMFNPPTGGGLLEEIKRLKKAGVSDKRLKELGFEYYKPTKEKVITETLKYAKRQMTWFKRDKDIKWFDSSRAMPKYL